jgi:teichuronic acid biosynthesis glycosyltransferase TuaG
MDLVSVITPYYKKKKFISQTINSVLQQTYSNFELIIIYDDKNYSDLLFIKKITKKDKRVKIIVNKKNIGAGKSRKKGIELSKGKFLAFLDADDYWNRNKLKEQISFMNKNKIKISHTSYFIIDSTNRIIGNRKALDRNHTQLLSSCDIGLSTVILDKKLITKNINFANIKTKEDYVLWLKITLNKNIIFAFKKNFTKWRKLNNSLSSSTFQKMKDGYYVYRKYMNFNPIKSIIHLLILSFNYLLKNR